MTQPRNQTAKQPTATSRPSAEQVSREAMRLQGTMRDLRAQAQANTQKKNNSGMGQVLKFAFLPDFKSAFSGIVQAWYLLVNTVAQLFVLAKLIDADHPAARYQAQYRFKLMEVINLSAKRLKFDRAHALQAVMFVAICLFLFSLAATLIMSLMALVVGSAHAATPADPNFIANDLLGGLFNLDSSGLIQRALGAMLSFYSRTTLIFAGFILIFIVISTVAETANSGVPFGKNFNHLWGPVRLIIALGMLVPLSSGLNSGQYLILYLAKFSSNIATQGWSQFAGFMNVTGSSSPTTGGSGTSHAGTTSNGGGAAQTNATPTSLPNEVATRSAMNTVNKLFQMELCASRNNTQYQNYGLGNGIYVVPSTARTAASSSAPVINSPILNQVNPMGDMVYTTISYLDKDLKDSCGNVTFRHYANSNLNQANSTDQNYDDYMMKGSYQAFMAFRAPMQQLVLKYRNQIDQKMAQTGQVSLSDLQSLGTDYDDLIKTYSKLWNDTSNYALYLLQQQVDANFSQEMAQSGWLGAPLWLYRVAQLNSSLQALAYGLEPQFGEVVDTGEGKLLQLVGDHAAATPNNPASVNFVVGRSFVDAVKDYANGASKAASSGVQQQGDQSTPGSIQNSLDADSGRALASGFAPAFEIGRSRLQQALTWIAGYLGCSDAKQCLSYFKAFNSNSNPITVVANLGQNFFSWGIEFYLSGASTATLGAGTPGVGSAVAGIGTIFFVLGTGFIGSGIMMGFLIPLAPVLRFYAAVVGWVMTVFQLILAIPIIALGHLSTKGDGYMGDMRSFYAALVGLVLRPLLITFGLIAGFAAFSVGAKIMNAVFIPAVESTFNINMQGVVLFHMAVFVFIYSFFLFALANSAFKMVDLVPDQAINWINARLEKQGTEDDFKQVGDAAKGGMVGLTAGGRELSTQISGSVSRPLGQTVTGALDVLNR